MVLYAVPPPEGAPLAAGRHPFRRRAADAGGGPRADEPSLGLAPLIVRDIFQIIREINKQGVTILLIEQNANMALHTADKGYVLETGEIILEGPGRELLENPVIREAYLGK